MRVAWRAQALDELETIIAYIAERNLPAAQRLHAAIEACAEALPAHPLAFRPVAWPARARRSFLDQ